MFPGHHTPLVLLWQLLLSLQFRSSYFSQHLDMLVPRDSILGPLSSSLPLATSSIDVALIIIYLLVTVSLYLQPIPLSWSLNSIFNCLFTISTGMTSRHLKFRISKAKRLRFSYAWNSLPSSADGNSVLPGAKKLRIILCFSCVTHPTYQNTCWIYLQSESVLNTLFASTSV